MLADIEAEIARLSGQVVGFGMRLGTIKLALEETLAQMREVVIELRKLRDLVKKEQEPLP